MAGALSGVQVLELGHGISGPFAARLLGDFGADVIKVEPPGGEFGRSLGHQLDGGHGGYLFNMLNWNKRGLVLDLRDAGSAEILRPLVAKADIVIESFRPGTLERWGFGIDTLRGWNRRAVFTSVSGYGQHGPQAHWNGSDLVYSAMSGMMHMSGRKPPRYPIKQALRQTLYGAGLSAAYASLAAYYAARRTGRGAHIDLAIREVVASELVTALSYYTFTGLVQGRLPGTSDPFEGDPIVMPGGRIALQAPPACPMTRWAEFLGIPELADPEYTRTVQRVKHVDVVRPMVEKRLADFTAKELYLRGAKEGMLIAIAQDAQQLLDCEQLAARGLFAPLPGYEDSGVRVPVELVRMLRTPTSVRRRAPRVGEHDGEIRRELAGVRDLGPADARATKAAAPDGARLKPLAGLKVLDISNVMSGPYIGALLADLGASVIKVEGPGRLDPARTTWGPPIDNDPGEDPWNRCGAFQFINRGKRSLVCDFATDEGQSILVNLIAESDILLENFTPRVMRNWGLTPQRLAEINPRLISLANSGYGATGPWQNFKAQGTTLEVMMGTTSYTGYPDGPPSKAGQSYPDFIACWLGLTAIMSALVEREKSGLGQAIDQGMYQIGAALLPEAFIHFQVTGEDIGRLGACDIEAFVSGVFESAEHDEWVAVSIASSDQVRGLAAAEIVDADATDPHKVREQLTRWVRTQLPGEAARVLQGAGIPAGKVMSMADIIADEHLLQRGFFEYVDLGSAGLRPYFGRPYRFSDYDVHVRGRAPHFGEHNREILAELGTCTPGQIDDLYAKGILAEVPRDRVRVGLAVDQEVMTGPSGNFSTWHDDYPARLAERLCRAEAAGTAYG